MGVRLNKVIVTLNIGLDTVYNFLSRRPDLGTVENLTLNSKITDEQYDALKNRYQKDSEVKKRASVVFSKINENKSYKIKRKNKNDASGLEIHGKIDVAVSNNKLQLTKQNKFEPKHVKEDTTKDNSIKVSLGELDFTKHQIIYWLNGEKFVLPNKQISAKYEKVRDKFENIRATIQLDYRTRSFNFVESDILPSLIQIYQGKEKERKGKKKEKDTKKLNQNLSNALNSILEKVEKTEKNVNEVNLSIPLSRISFSGSLAIVVYKSKTFSSYVTKSEKRLLMSLNRTQSVPVIIDTTGKTFRFDINISELLNRIDFLKQAANKEPLQQQKTRLEIENVEFHDNYYLVWIIRQGKKDVSIKPLKVADNNSLHCLRLIHKYFSDRFPKGIEIIYDSQRVISLTQEYTLGSYIRVLNESIDERGEWWEEVQNDRKPSLAVCRKTSQAQISKEVSLRNCYLDYLAGMPNQKIAIKVYEVRQNIQEDVFLFTVNIDNGHYAIIFENVSFTSTATWLFIVRKEKYEECINRIFDYFTNYELHNKRQSLIKSLNPPQKFKAEEYYKIMHDEPKGWIKRLNDILIREIPSNRIQFNQGLHIAEEADSRSCSPEMVKVQHLHNDLMRRLFYQLCQQYGVENVGTENHIGTKKIDVVVRTGEGFNIYEIKTGKDPRSCVREAMGQILDYAFFECEDVIHKMIIVGAAQETKEVSTYLAKFREKNALEIYYIAV